jgi:hypothetical protein
MSKKLWHFVERNDSQNHSFYMGDEGDCKRSFVMTMPGMKIWGIADAADPIGYRGVPLDQSCKGYDLIETKKGWLVVRHDIRFVLLADIPDGIPALRKKIVRGIDSMVAAGQELNRMTDIPYSLMSTFWEDERLASDEHIIGFVDVEYLRHGPMTDRAAILKLYEEWMQSADNCNRPWTCCKQERSHETLFCSNCGKHQPKLARPELRVGGRWISVQQMQAVWNDEIRRRKLKDEKHPPQIVCEGDLPSDLDL